MYLCLRVFGCAFRLKAQLMHRTQDLCVDASDMIETKYNSTYRPYLRMTI